MKITLLLIFVFLSFFCSGQAKIEHFILTTGGERIDIKKIVSLNGDSVFYFTKESKAFINIDSIAEYHLHKSSKVLQGFLIGCVSGIVIGSLTGFLSSDVDPSATNTNSGQGEKTTQGAIIGGLAGAVLGTIAGLISNKNIDVDFKNYKTNVKKQYIVNLI